MPARSRGGPHGDAILPWRRQAGRAGPPLPSFFHCCQGMRMWGGAAGGQEGPDIWPPNKQPTASRKGVLKGFIPTLSCSAPIYRTLPFSEYGHRFALRPGVLMRIQLLLVTLRIP